MFNRVDILRTTAVVLACSLPAFGQYFVQQGNVLDANNRVGSGGLNYGGQVYRPNLTNRLVTGNVTGGAAFRGYSPIRDPNSFFLGAAQGTAGATGVSGLITGLGGGLGSLPSDRLTTFRRDSVSLNEIRRLQVAPTIVPQPYYSQTSTVADTGQIVRGLNQPGTSQIRSSYTALPRDTLIQPINPLETGRNSLIGSPLSVDARLVRADTGQMLAGPVNQRLLGSPLFGGIREVPVSRLAGQNQNMAVSTDPRAGLLQRGGGEAGTEGPGRSAIDRRTALDRDLNRQPDAAAMPGNPDYSALNRPVGAREEFGKLDPNAGSLSRSIQTPVGGSDGQNLLRRPRTSMDEATVGTFVGTAEERINAEMAEAEKMLREDRYYDAARRYQMAQAVDLRNPRPLFGRALALLAAGDYLSSANDLFMAIDLAGPEQAARFDLRGLLPKLENLDMRRAFLEQRLEAYEDFRLRFLLGWAEHASGLREAGLADMRKGAQAAPSGSPNLTRYIEVLASEPAAQPPATTRPG